MLLPESIDYLACLLPKIPEAIIILGSGLSGPGSLADLLHERQDFLFSELPFFHTPANLSNPDIGFGLQPRVLSYGILDAKAVLLMQGRAHFYQGYSGVQIGFPIQTFAGLGIKNILITNAAGSLNPNFRLSDLMIVTDHIGLFAGDLPIIKNKRNLADPYFTDISDLYSISLQALAADWAKLNDKKIYHGVYIGLPGPMLQTRAETRMLSRLGADAVGNSLVAEALAAGACGMNVFGCSVITDLGPMYPQNTVSQTIIEAAQKSLPNLNAMLRYMIIRL